MIDYENVPIKTVALLTGEQFEVRVFLGPKNTKLPLELVLTMQALKQRAEYIVLETVGNNALDFHIAYTLGTLAAAEPDAFFHIISKDTGFDPLLDHLKKQKITAVRSVSLETMPCFQPPAAPPAPQLPLEKPIPPAIKTVIKAVTGSNQTQPAPQPSIDALVNIARNDLIKRKQGKPAKPATLLNTIQSVCGKNVPQTKIEQVYAELIKRGYVKENTGAIHYSL
nr:PIN domain-containing protein [Chromatium okenii]